MTLPTFDEKQWKNFPDTSTPRNADAYMDMEQRLSGFAKDYADARTAAVETSVDDAQVKLAVVRESPLNVEDERVGGNISTALSMLPTVGGRRTGSILLPAAKSYDVTTMLNLDGAASVVIKGEGGTSGYPRLVWKGGAGSGPMIQMRSAFGIEFRSVLLGYDNAAYDGELIVCGHDGSGQDTNFELDRCWVGGLGAASGAAWLLNPKQAINSKVRNGFFQNAQNAIKGRDGGTYTTTLTIEDNQFAQLPGDAIYNPDNTWRILNNTFEPSPDGSACGINHDLSYWTQALVMEGNYFGDVTSGGGTWVKLRASGSRLVGNFHTQPGPSAGATHYALDSCLGLVLGNWIGGGTNGYVFTSATNYNEGIVIEGGTNTATNPVVGAATCASLTDLTQYTGGSPTNMFKGRNLELIAGASGAGGSMLFSSAVTAASVPNNTLFRSSADGKLHYKDNAGADNALY
jgi:hypothetical protein